MAFRPSQGQKNTTRQAQPRSPALRRRKSGSDEVARKTDHTYLLNICALAPCPPLSSASPSCSSVLVFAIPLALHPLPPLLDLDRARCLHHCSPGLPFPRTLSLPTYANELHLRRTNPSFSSSRPLAAAWDVFTPSAPTLEERSLFDHGRAESSIGGRLSKNGEGRRGEIPLSSLSAFPGRI
jgi:hypothetical protein